jgi:predicted ester cyclase
MIMQNTTGLVAMAACVALGIGMGYGVALRRQDGRLERNKAIVRRIHHEIWSAPDNRAAAKTLDQVLAPDFVMHDWTGDTRGLTEFNKSLFEWRAAFPDWSEEVQDIVAEGNFVVTRFTSGGTQRGDLAAVPGLSPAIPAKGRQLRLTELSLWHIVNGKASEEWDFYDNWGASIQLGLIDPQRICPVQIAR